MSSSTRLTKALKNSKRISFDDNSKLILFSDCHRSDNSFADDFANNRNVYFHAMSQYFQKGFTYIEIGDGDELWENIFFKTIFEAHKNVYLLLKKFYDAQRLHMIYGNHDIVYANQNYVKKNLWHYTDTKDNCKVPLFPWIKYNEGIILEHTLSKKEIFLTHGHQAEFLNSVWWKFNQFMVRIIWKPLQIWGISDPTSPAKNYTELIKVERRIKDWITLNDRLMTITGHTHRPRFPQPTKDERPYFNTGSCVHPRSITGIEIENGEITLIKWFIDTKEDGTLQIVKEILEGPTKIASYS